MLAYSPNGMSMWDTWCIEHEGVVHAFYLQRLTPGSSRNQPDEDFIGHAVSADLIHWEECELALPPGEPGGLDDMQAWTGCVYKCGEKFHMYYTMRSTRDGGAGQYIGLAISDDLYHWERYSGNPIISPDKRWYISHYNPLDRGTVDARDLIIVRHPDDTKWLGYFAARIQAKEMAQSSVIAAAQSTDLIHWEQLPPAFVPKKYACIELPDVYEIDGKWYMTCLAGNTYGNRGIYSDPYVTNGTIYAVADNPEGPFEELDDDNVLIGGNVTSGYSCRTFMFNNERYLLYTEPSMVSQTAYSTLSPPTLVKSVDGGKLRTYYSNRTQVWRKKQLIGENDSYQIMLQPYCHPAWALRAGNWQVKDGVYTGESKTGYQTADICDASYNMEMEANFTIHSGAGAGFIIRQDKSQDFVWNAMAFYLDAECNSVLTANLLDFTPTCRRKFNIATGREYHIRVCVRNPRIEIFIDDELVLQTAANFPEMQKPSLGLLVDRGNVSVKNIKAYEL
jgi:beta-fructofuranosidase